LRPYGDVCLIDPVQGTEQLSDWICRVVRQQGNGQEQCHNGKDDGEEIASRIAVFDHGHTHRDSKWPQQQTLRLGNKFERACPCPGKRNPGTSCSLSTFIVLKNKVFRDVDKVCVDDKSETVNPLVQPENHDNPIDRT
jgi:hypothetical protein